MANISRFPDRASSPPSGVPLDHCSVALLLVQLVCRQLEPADPNHDRLRRAERELRAVADALGHSDADVIPLRRAVSLASSERSDEPGLSDLDW